MKIHARFWLAEDGRVKSSRHVEGNQWETVESIRVKLYPVQGEPFGQATPSGSLEMVIANPDAAKLFREAAIGQEFDAVFSLVEKPAEV